MFMVKSINSGAPSDHEVKPSYVRYVIQQDKTELLILKLTSEFHHLPRELVPSSCVR